MKNSTRLLLLACIIETGLLGLTVYLIFQLESGGMHASMPVGEAVTRIATIMGAVIGVFSAIWIFLFIALRRKGL